MSDSNDRKRDVLLSDILTNIQIQVVQLHNLLTQQTELEGLPPLSPSKRTQLSISSIKYINDAQFELKEKINQFNHDYINNPVLIVPISYTPSTRPSIRVMGQNSMRAMKNNKGTTGAAIIGIIIAIITLILKQYGIAL
jgi:hypothetical protein